MLGYHRVGFFRRRLKDVQVLLCPDVSQHRRRVARQAALLRALHRRFPELLAERSIVERENSFSDCARVTGHEIACAKLLYPVFGCESHVPRTNVLADVTAVQAISDLLP